MSDPFPLTGIGYLLILGFLSVFLGFSISFIVFQFISYFAINRKFPSFTIYKFYIFNSLVLGLLFAAICSSLFLFLSSVFVIVVIVVLVILLFLIFKRYISLPLKPPVFLIQLFFSIIVGISILPIGVYIQQQNEQRDQLKQEIVKNKMISEYKIIALEKNQNKTNSLDIQILVPKTREYLISVYGYFSNHLQKGEYDIYKYPKDYNEPIRWVDKVSLKKGVNIISVPIINNYPHENNSSIDIEMNVNVIGGSSGVSFYSPYLANCTAQMGLPCVKESKFHLIYY